MDTRTDSLSQDGLPAEVLSAELPIGAAVFPDGVRFRVWAPNCREVLLEWWTPTQKVPSKVRLEREPRGYHSVFVPGARTGDWYGYRLEGCDSLCPDPASRFQPEGPRGPSEIIDPSGFAWSDQQWRGVSLAGQVLYEMHIGTFTREGTWRAAQRELAELAAAGITLLEIMPIASFPGRFNWGYDGVDLFAPSQLYGRPDDLRSFIDTAHRLGIGVLLDVVYNHMGPHGCCLPHFSQDYFTDRYRNDWGASPNFDGPNSAPVREYFVGNAAYWIREYHFDGLRIDATQDIHDSSPKHVLRSMTCAARKAAGRRAIVILAECEPQLATLMRPVEQNGMDFDGAWNDDFHHAANVALRARNEAYYSDYRGTAQELLSTCKYGYLYQGQVSGWQKKPRGTPALDLAPWRFVNYLENHDQIANSLDGRRNHHLASPASFRAISALQLLAPGTPLLFQGQEFASSAPFVFFADHASALAGQVEKGRRDFLSQFPSLASDEAGQCIPPPASEQVFQQCKLDFRDRERNVAVYQMYKDLLRLRREEPALRPRPERWFDGAVLGPQAFVLRYFGPLAIHDRLLLVNLGLPLPLSPLPEPLMAPPAGCRWALRWSSEDPRYGGLGTPRLQTDVSWMLPGQVANWLYPEEIEENKHG